MIPQTPPALPGASLPGLKETCDKILSQIALLVLHDAANIMMLTGDALRMVAWRGYDAFEDDDTLDMLEQPLDHFPLIDRAMRRREVLYISDTHESADWVWHGEARWIRSHLAVPIFQGDSTLGVLRVDSQERDAFSDEDVSKLQLLAGVAAFALENVHLYEAMQQEIIERREAEAQTHEHEFRLRHLTGQLPISVWGLDKELRITHQLGGVTYVGDVVNENRDALEGTSVYDFLCDVVNKKMADERMAVFKRTLAGETMRYSYKLRNRYVEDIMSPARNENGDIIGIVGAASDVTERVEAEQALLNAERRLRYITSQLPMAIWSTDADLRIVHYSSTLRGDEGYEERSPTYPGKTLPELHQTGFSADEAERRLAYYTRVLAGGTVQYESEFGDDWVQVTLSPLRDDTGAIVGLVGLALDVTERVKAAEALQNAERRLQHITSQLPMALWSTDEHMDLTHFTSSLQTPENYADWRSEIAGDASVEEALSDEVVERREEFWLRALAGETVHYENQFFDRWVEDTLSPLRDEDGTIIGTVGVAIDITERKKMEEEIQRIQRMESLSVLAGRIAHDFNNYLTAILSHLSMASRSLPDDSDVHMLLLEAEKATQRADALTQQLSTFAKGGVPVRQTISISQVILDTVSFSLVGSRVGLESDISDDLWPVNCDEGLISQAIGNIVLNAEQATPGSGYIQVSAHNVQIGAESSLLPAGDYVEIAITDQGIGIPEEHLTRLFDPFFTTKSQGTGLGLPSAHSIIQKHDGHIAVESQIDEGTTFRIYLPASEEQVVLPVELDVEPVAGSGRILSMDDDSSLRFALELMLQSLGYEPEFAADGQEAITMYSDALAAGNPYDVVLMDLTVAGGMGGLEAAGEIVKMDGQARLIITSGYSDDPVMANYRDHGFCAVIPKPFEVIRLSRVLHQVLDERKMGE